MYSSSSHLTFFDNLGNHRITLVLVGCYFSDDLNALKAYCFGPLPEYNLDFLSSIFCGYITCSICHFLGFFLFLILITCISGLSYSELCPCLYGYNLNVLTSDSVPASFSIHNELKWSYTNQL